MRLFSHTGGHAIIVTGAAYEFEEETVDINDVKISESKDCYPKRLNSTCLANIDISDPVCAFC